VSNTVTFNYDTSGRLYRKYFNGTTDYEQYDYQTNGYLYRIQFNGTTVWQITAMDNYGRITQASIGGVTGTWTYDANNMLSQIAATGVQQYGYSFNVNTGNLNSRTNTLKTLSESFGYDAVGLDRLTSVTGPANLTVGYTSNNNGNIQSKSDAGTGSYAYANTPYAVSSITGALNISATPQEIDYYSFEKVKKITEGTKTADFVYNADRQRIRMILKDNGVTSKTRWYFGSSCEREQVGSTVTQYIWIGGDAYSAVAVARKVGSGSWEVFNIFRDHLGTITHLKSGSTVYEYSFDAWGRRRDKDNWSYTLSGEPDLFAQRGFTAHEHLEDFNLVNMNGRLYDPVVGRFLGVDNEIQDPGFTQSYNRYSYALNNPLRYVDPAGNAGIEKSRNLPDDFFPGIDAYPLENMTTGRGGSLPGYFGLGFGINGPGLEGIYYDWNSDSYRNMYGQVVSWGQVLGLISSYGIRLPADAILGSIRMNNQGVWYQTVSVGAQERVGLLGSPFNATFSVDVVNAFIEYNAKSGGGNLFMGGGWHPPMALYNIDNAVNWLNNNAHESWKDAKGQCAYYIRMALEAGGINTSNHPVPARLYGSYLKSWGFSIENPTNYLKGDIAVIQGYPGATSDPRTGIPYGHIQMYNGSIWISDFKQNRPFWPGGKYEYYKPSFAIYRWGY
jgi:RHS repeat-associated protein